MKKVLFFAIASLFFMSSLNAQNSVIKLNLFSPLFKTYNFQFEQVIGEKKSAQLGLFYTGFKADETSFSGFGITPEMRFYLSSNDAPRGWFVAPFLRYMNFTLKQTILDEDAKATMTSIGGGLILGGQFIMGDHFTIESFIGPSYSAGSIKVKTEGVEEGTFSTGPFDGFGVRFGVCIGFAF